MKAITCAVIDGGDVICFTLEERRRVSDLKIAITERMAFRFLPHQLSLFLAQTSDGYWLKKSDPDITILKSGKVHGRIKQLMTPATELDESTELRELNLPDDKNDAIHVLVAKPHHVKILCAVVGIDDILRMNIDERDSVMYLKQAIKESIGFPFHWCELKLYVAKVNNAHWLRSDNPGVSKLKAGEISREIKRMMTDVAEMKGEYELSEFHFTQVEAGPSGRQLHVIVDLPAYSKAIARYART
ncbi:hypothetical protein DYB26_004009 [Aphanomyces astaci]|uniref:Crinkler effector protein N-terminal domain-containing protein n=1 Tax=Aphanomyces astaci TaxID=112090 RepID=A0A3R7EWQ3_APHAT|nr:hypothetical protein DYB26_004009 [Aphanomyces astaci]